MSSGQFVLSFLSGILRHFFTNRSLAAILLLS